MAVSSETHANQGVYPFTYAMTRFPLAAGRAVNARVLEFLCVAPGIGTAEQAPHPPL